MPPRLGLHAFWFYYLFYAALPLVAQEAEKRLPVPDEATQAAAMKLVKEVYGDEYAKAKSAEQKTALAKKLIEQAGGTSDSPASRFVLLKIARDITAQASNTDLAFQAVDKMAEVFAVDTLEMKLGVLTTVSKKAHTAAAHKANAEWVMTLLAQAVASDAYPLADQLGSLLSTEANKAGDYQLLKAARARITEMETLSKGYKEAQAAAKTLDTKPTDPEANLIIGKYLCFVKNNWDKGLTSLALGNDKQIRDLSRQDMERAASSADQLKLGDGWWSLAEEQGETAQKHIRARAGYWYRQALPGLAGLAKAKVEKRLGGTVKLGLPPAINLSPLIELQKDVVAGVWKVTSEGLMSDISFIARVQIPYQPPEEYDFRIAFTRLNYKVKAQHSGWGDIFQVLQKDNSPFGWYMGAHGNTWFGFEMVGGKRFDKNPTGVHVEECLQLHRRYTATVAVRKDSVKAFLDGKQISAWQPQFGRLSESTYLTLPDKTVLGLGACNVQTVFHKIEVLEVTGKGRVLRGASPTSP